MKKTTAKNAKPKRKVTTYALRGQDTRPYAIDLSRAEMLTLAAAHLKRANDMPKAFGKYIRDNPKLTRTDLDHVRKAYLALIEDHLKRAEELQDLAL